MDNNKNEMEEIQRGLEAFLEKELDSARDSGSREKSGRRGGAAEEPEEIRIIGQPWGREPEPEGWEDEEEAAYSEDWEDWEDESRRDPEYPGYEEEEEPYPEDWEDRPPRRRGQEHDAHRGAEPYHRRRQDAKEDARSRRYRDEAPVRRRPEYEEPDEHEEEERPRERKKSRKRGDSKETEPDQGKGDSRMSGKNKKSQKAQKKGRKRKSRLKKFLIAAVLIIALLGVGLYQLVGAVYGKMNYKELEAMASAPMKEDGVVNILLIGNDSRENGEDGRSDAMILLSISSRTKTIYMTSLLRDIYVDIPGHEGNRLNAAYAFGGAQLLMETIEHNFDIPVNRYMLVNFEAFANLVDAVGGIELELSKGEIEYVNGYLWEYNMLTGREDGTDNMDPSVAENGPAVVHLNGPQALAYSRNRYMGTDFGRTERQRKILTAVIDKLPMALLTNAGGLIDGLMPNLTTNLTKNECFSLSLMAGKMLTYDIVSDNIPQPDTYRDVTIREMQVLEVDFETNIRYLKQKIYGE